MDLDQNVTQDGSWDHVAGWYDSLSTGEGAQFQEKVIIPGVLRLLQLNAGESVMDLACGQGALCRALQRAGSRVTGVDISPRLIDIARRRSSGSIRYLVGDARRLEGPSGGTFEAAVCVLAAQNIEPVAPLFAEARRLLRPGGRLVVVLNHPCFRIPRQSGWHWNEASKLLYRGINRYLSPLKIPIDMAPFKDPGRTLTWTYHRPLQTYIEALVEAGLWINALEEWQSHKVSQPGRVARAENRARREFPLFRALRAVRVPDGLTS